MALTLMCIGIGTVWLATVVGLLAVITGVKHIATKAYIAVTRGKARVRRAEINDLIAGAEQLCRANAEGAP